VGLIPSWAKDAKLADSMINARSETAATKPAIRAAFKQRSYLTPSTGFSEWTGRIKGHLLEATVRGLNRN